MHFPQLPGIKRSFHIVYSIAVLQGSHVVIHEYVAGPDAALYLGERLRVVDNGDPDWLYGFKVTFKQISLEKH